MRSCNDQPIFGSIHKSAHLAIEHDPSIAPYIIDGPQYSPRSYQRHMTDFVLTDD